MHLNMFSATCQPFLLSLNMFISDVVRTEWYWTFSHEIFPCSWPIDLFSWVKQHPHSSWFQWFLLLLSQWRLWRNAHFVVTSGLVVESHDDNGIVMEAWQPQVCVRADVSEWDGVVCSTSLMASLIRSVGGPSKCFYQGLWLAVLSADVIGQSINRNGVA